MMKISSQVECFMHLSWMSCLVLIACFGKAIKDDEIDNNCGWVTSMGYWLDLSALYSSSIEYTDRLTNIKYIYTPCNDGVICEQNKTNTASMAIQENSNGFCVSYLAKFDGMYCRCQDEDVICVIFTQKFL